MIRHKFLQKNGQNQVRVESYLFSGASFINLAPAEADEVA